MGAGFCSGSFIAAMIFPTDSDAGIIFINMRS